MHGITCICFLLVTTFISAQNFSDDIRISVEADFGHKVSTHYSGEGNSASILKEESSSVFTRYNPLRWIGKGLLWGYQNLVSPQLQADCAYELSCSNFSKQAIQYYGIIKGLALSADRLTRCNTMATQENPSHKYNLATENHEDRVEFYQMHRH